MHPLLSLQLTGQLDGGSHVSPGSTTPLPQLEVQSLSVFESHPAGQQPSLFTHATMEVCEHATLQLSGLPVMVSFVHELPS